jgi:hypothetical protein
MDEKDRLGDKLRDKEKAEEDRYFAEREKAALRKLAEKHAAETGNALGRCPRCGCVLVTVDQDGITVDQCPNRHGVWVDEGELQPLASRERDSWLARLVARLKV